MIELDDVGRKLALDSLKIAEDLVTKLREQLGLPAPDFSATVAPEDIPGPEKKRYRFDIGDSNKGPLGMTAVVIASSAADALESLRAYLDDHVPYDGYAIGDGGPGGVLYVEVFANTKALTPHTIYEIDEADEEEIEEAEEKDEE